MPYYQTTIFSGDVCEIEEYFSPRTVGKRIPRGSRENLTSAQQAEINLRRARKELARKINCNFSQGDLFLTLTYAKEPTLEAAKDQLRKYLRQLRNTCKKLALPALKYIAVTEYKEKRIHHHLVVSAMPLEAAMDPWPCGRVLISRLTPGSDYTGLANYITKETTTKDGKLCGKRWSSSRNLAKPRIVRKVIKKERSRPRLLQAPKGYKEIQRYFYASDATGQSQYLKAVRIGGCDYSEGGNNL